MANTGSVQGRQTRPLGRGRGRRWPLVLGTVVATVLVVLGMRWFNGDSLAMFGKTAHKECLAAGSGEYCVAWVSYPDLLVADGREEIQVYLDGDEGGRFYSVPDPFGGDPSGVSIRAEDAGIVIVGEMVTVTWGVDKLNRLGD